MRLKITLAVVLVFITLTTSVLSLAAETWVPVKDVSLLIEEGSILDFSSLLPPAKPITTRIIVNQQGHFSLENSPEKPVRFLIGSLGFGVATGSFPTHAIADLYVQQFRRHGYNMARLDFIEATLMEGRAKDFDYNPEQLDRLYYLLAALKNNGIYYVLNGLSSDNGGYGNINERWIGQKQLALGVYFDVEKQAHWKKLINTMYGTVNPYTGIATIKDPAFAGMVLVNENNLVFVNRQGVSPLLKPLFSKWLKAKYGSNAALKAAWGNELKADENIEANKINFPAVDAWTSHRMSDTQQFFVETEKNTASWMTQYVRELGFQGQVTSYNLWHAPAAQATRGQFSWVDMHNYFAHPEYSGQQMTVRQDSMLATSASYVRELAAARHLGKAFTVTEFGQVFWNQYRRESGLAIPAYAALQAWDGICQHSGAVILSYAGAGSGNRDKLIGPFAVGQDPIARATETLAALLYLRGDVAPAKHIIDVKLTAQDAFDKSAHFGNTPSDISKLSLVTGTGLDWQGKTESNSLPKIQVDAQVSFNAPGIKLTKSGGSQAINSTLNMASNIDHVVKKYAGNLVNQTLAYKIRKVNFIADNNWSARVQNLRDAKLLDDNNQTNAEEGIYQSDTNEITLNSQQRLLTVVTPRTEAIVFDEFKPVRLNQLSVLSGDSSALVAVSAMDGLPLAQSKRMLLVLSTDARNSNMRFSDMAQTTLLDMGKPPVIIRAAKVSLNLKNTNKNQLKVFSTNLRGQRQDLIPITKTDNGIMFTLDISKLSHGATTYFEISI